MLQPATIPPEPAVARLVRRLLVGWFRRGGWSVAGDLPLPAKCVIMGAPHTSNLDFLVFLGAMEELGLAARYLGKDSLFRWKPMGDVMRAFGGIAVDRTARQDLTANAARMIRQAPEFALVVAPEGTRRPTRRWKTGFYRIALEAGVPIVCAGPDYGRRQAVFGPRIQPTGDMNKDLAPAWPFFRSLVPRHPENALFPDGFGMDVPAAGA